jgi:pyruvate/2-oxoglutarate/acetoin dehydrogenase E1 component
MSEAQRVVDNLNRGLHGLLERDDNAFVLGEDVADPYGGAFRVTRGLSTGFPGRVRNTAISEGALVGMACGLALAGRTVVAEIMFSDFVTLAMDQLINVAAKLPTMFGTRVPVRLVVRLPTGAGRGYGATHSQSLQKHFVGVPGLSLFEMTPFHDAGALFVSMVDLGTPCLIFEDKVLYTRWMSLDGPVGVFTLSRVGAEPGIARLSLDGVNPPDCVLVCAGGTVERVMAAACDLLVREELTCELLVPAQLYPADVATLAGLAARARRVFVIDEGTAGGTWGGDLAFELSRALWHRLSGPVELICSRPLVIPAATHLESQMIVQAADVIARVTEAFA